MLTLYMAETSEIPFDAAARITGMRAEILRHLVRNGVLRGSAPYRAGLVGSVDRQQAVELAHQINAARKPFEGIGILVSEAADKYGFHIQTIYNWIEAGWVQEVTPSSKGRMVNEADIALASEIAKRISYVPGKAVFPPRRSIA